MQFLVMSKIRPGASPEQIRPLLEAEARASCNHYTRGLPRLVFSRSDSPNLIARYEAAGKEELAAELAALPLPAANLVEFEVIGLAPNRSPEALFAHC